MITGVKICRLLCHSRTQTLPSAPRLAERKLIIWGQFLKGTSPATGVNDLGRTQCYTRNIATLWCLLGELLEGPQQGKLGRPWRVPGIGEGRSHQAAATPPLYIDPELLCQCSCGTVLSSVPSFCQHLLRACSRPSL